MNITHAVPEEVNGDKLVAIFERQKELMDKYHDIELRSGLLQTEDCPVNLDDKRGQARIKDFAWRVTEEIGEALDALVIHEDEVHFQEELIDGLHFLTELSILAGLNPYELKSSEDDDIIESLYKWLKNINALDIELETLITQLVLNLGMTCNCLKNKPWKQTNMLTDKNNFYNNLKKTWFSYLNILFKYMTPQEVTDIYLKKSQVNKFRQRSNY